MSRLFSIIPLCRQCTIRDRNPLRQLAPRRQVALPSMAPRKQLTPSSAQRPNPLPPRMQRATYMQPRAISANRILSPSSTQHRIPQTASKISIRSAAMEGNQFGDGRRHILRITRPRFVAQSIDGGNILGAPTKLQLLKKPEGNTESVRRPNPCAILLASSPDTRSILVPQSSILLCTCMMASFYNNVYVHSLEFCNPYSVCNSIYFFLTILV
jgi:hypothetical protein